MVLHFPNLDVLKIAITSGIVPESIVMAPVKAGFGTAGELWLQPAGRVPRGVRADLRRLGVEETRSSAVPVAETFHCWLQVFPLDGDLATVAVSDKTPVLFDLAGTESLAELVSEVLRLGNDRQSFCHVSTGGRIRALLRVVGPPYYSLLRAMDRDAAPDIRPCAYIEQAPRVWVEIGHRHPLADRMVPPAGQFLLIRAARGWDFVEEGTFQDVYRAFAYQLPHAASVGKPTPLAQRIAVPLRLVTGGTEAAELWVLGDGGEDQLDAMVGSADDALLARLAFAVGQCEGRRRIVLRVRPSKQGPPVVVLDAVAFHPYLKLPNLFVPCGWRVHPPLRRSAVAELLASGDGSVTWLFPHGDGTFTPESLPEAAFCPLTDWVDYVLDRERVALAAWIDSQQFEFEPFVCEEDRRPREEKPKPPPGSATEPRKDSPPPSTPPEEVHAREPLPAADPPPSLVVEQAAETERDVVQKRLSELEQQFLASDSPLDSPERAGLWQEMGHVNAALGYHLDAGVCFSSAVWEQEKGIPSVVGAWQKSACQACGITLTGQQLDRELADRDMLADRASFLASQVISAAWTKPVPEPLVERLSQVARYLERHEALLPVRIVWLAWRAIDRLSGGDVLALARARDRCLERLYQHGLRPDVDLPSFLRGHGLSDSHQLRLLRDRTSTLHTLVADWIQEPPVYANARTRAYARLLFAYAMARLGEMTHCQVLQEEAREALALSDPVHRWLWDAFQFRLREVQGGQPDRGRLSQELLGRLESMNRLDRYKIDRLRQNSRILEPWEKIDPYRNWRQYADDFTKEVTSLVDVADHEELQSRINRLFAEIEQGNDAGREALLLATALQLAPRLGEPLATGLLDRVVPLLSRGVEPAAGQLVLEKALFVAAHFDLHAHIELYMTRICGLLERLQPDQALESLEGMLSECFRGLRKLGMRDEIGRLLSRVAALVHSARSANEPNGVLLRLLLLAAGGWLFFGQQREAIGALDEVREVLLQESRKPSERVDLAEAYFRALSFAPAEFALPRIEELFAPGPPDSDGAQEPRLPRVQDNLTTVTHFSLFQLKIVEALVLAIVGEEFAVNSQSRRWLDEDEFLVRRRIHHDVRTALGHSTT